MANCKQEYYTEEYGTAKELLDKLENVLYPDHHQDASSGGDDIEYVYNASSAKNNIFVIKALNSRCEVKRSNEAYQRQLEVENFKKEVEAFARQYIRRDDNHPYVEDVDVDSYSEMKTKFENYLKETPDDVKPNDIILVFLGHGSEPTLHSLGVSKLCFANGGNVPVNSAFNDLYNIHENSQIQSSLHIVFAQCFAHAHGIATEGDSTARDTYHQASGGNDAKFMFLTGLGDPKTTTRVRFVKESQHEPSGLSIIGTDRFVDDPFPDDLTSMQLMNLEEFETYIQSEFNVTLTTRQRDTIFRTEKVPLSISQSDYDELYSNLDQIIEKIHELKREIKYYGHFKITNPKSEKAGRSIKEHISNPNGYQFDTVEVNSFDNLNSSMMEFINVGSKILFICISGYCKTIEGSEKYEMVFGDNECKSIEDIMKIANSSGSSSDVRVTFFCEEFSEDTVDGGMAPGEQIIISNSVKVLPKAEHMELGDAMPRMLEHLKEKE